ncbi:MAG TPA: ribosomal protein S18-alanine N-acetyltransferase [Terriglobales bacterium]|nr:ribosomal protein S18-alanine N-acetyltransferase [Terriglobales bacterium]
MPVRPATVADLPAMLAIERASPTAAHWPEAEYRRLFAEEPTQPRLALVAEEDTSVVGFVVARGVAGEWELENLVVAASVRRRGLGSLLLEALLYRLRALGAAAVFLEVRESNQTARRLYERHGFLSSGRRRAYYQDPPEDALLYRLAFPQVE